MTTELEQAYASNTETPLETLEFSHSALSGGVMRFVRGYQDLEATLEDGSTVTFTASGIDVQLPEKSTDGQQNLTIAISNDSNLVYEQLDLVQESMRTSDERAIFKYRPYLPSDLSAPAASPLRLIVTSATITDEAALIQCTYTPFPDSIYPRYRYYASTYPGVKYL